MSAREREKGVNVQVLLRCRPFSDEEVRLNVPQVVSCNEHRKEVSVYQNVVGKQVDRTFTFDRVFGTQSRQKDLYDQAIVPIVHEVLEGFNCTIFAYGQTGTGKTYTMEGGGKKARQGELSGDAGVIPRAVQQIFDTLESQMAEYSVKVTFLELYNEEITDLLAPADDLIKVISSEKEKKPLALMEDGKGGVMVRGLEEEIVRNASEIYTLLERGSAKRRTAETLLNKQSSRSHSIFSITMHIKESTPEGEELIKCGKLNLVDLAGSENISRSGAREGRAREAGEINKSLLTLGRVITALVEHLGHIPYRDSKLTRLLRDSLGGRTKTCIIATVSPSVQCLEETLSTLDYAHRAKSIKNKPEVNQKMTKSALLKDMSGEIERLKLELYAAREKNGIYLPKEKYIQDELERKAMAEKIELLESSVEAKEKVLEEIQDICEGQRRQYEELSSEHEDTKAALKLTQTTLSETEQSLKAAEFAINEREFMLKKHQHAEAELVNYATGIRNKLESSTKDISGLHQKIDRKVRVETINKELGSVFNSSFVGQLEELNGFVKAAVGDQIQGLSSISGLLDSFKARKAEEFNDLSNQLQNVQTLLQHDRARVKESVGEFVKALTSSFHGVESLHGFHRAQLDKILAESVGQAEEIIQKLQCKLLDQQRSIAVFANHQREIARKSLEASRHIAESTQESLRFLENCSSDCASFYQLNFELQHKELKTLRTQYEERALEEEKRLMDEISGLLKASRSRKLELVESGIIAAESALTAGKIESKSFTEKIGKKAADAFALVSAFHKTVEADDVENRAMAASKHCQMEGIIQDCIETGVAARQQWLELQTAVVNLEKEHAARVIEDVSGGLDVATGFEVAMGADGDTAYLNIKASRAQLLKTLEDDFEKDNNCVGEIQGAVTVQREKVFSVAGSHQNHSEGLHKCVEKYFQEFVVDSPTATTPPKRSLTVPNEAAIIRLRTPPVEDLVSEFHKENPPPPFYQEKLWKHNVVSTNILQYSTDTEVKSPRQENRAPLGVVNQ